MVNSSNVIEESSLSYVLKELLEKFDNLSGSELAKRTGLPTSTINRILAGTVSDPRISTLKPIANYFGLSVDQLLGYVELPVNYSIKAEKKSPSLAIPNYSYKSLNNDLDTPNQWFTWVTEKKNPENNCFALTIDTTKYEPIFEQDTILIVEPNTLPPQHNDYVVLKFDKKQTIHIRKFYSDGDDNFFLSC